MGSHGSLKWYWALDGSATWHAEIVARAGTTFSAPSLDNSFFSANICAIGSRDSLKFYSKGGHGWQAEQVAPPGSVR